TRLLRTNTGRRGRRGAGFRFAARKREPGHRARRRSKLVPGRSLRTTSSDRRFRMERRRPSEGSRFRTEGELSSTDRARSLTAIAKSSAEVWEAIADFAFDLQWRKDF